MRCYLRAEYDELYTRQQIYDTKEVVEGNKINFRIVNSKGCHEVIYIIDDKFIKRKIDMGVLVIYSVLWIPINLTAYDSIHLLSHSLYVKGVNMT